MSKSRSESIFKQFSAALKGFIIKQTSSSNEAEDLLHDVFYKFIVADGEDEIIENVSSWLYRVTRNQIIDNSRKIKETKLPPLAELFMEDQNAESEQATVNAMIREEIEEALAELPAEQRSIFTLNELQGIPFKEISQSTGIPVNTLISRKHYATQHLRKRLSWLYNEL
ncbi:MAG: sigma-70 family RNA polymerase sigma factor [Rikenellaceae bacterium]